MYNSCSGSTHHNAYDPFEELYGNSDYKLQNGMPSPYCLYSQNYSVGVPGKGPGNCFVYFPNEWLTYQVHVKMGPRVNDEFTNSYVQLWIAREGQPSQLVINWGPYYLSAGTLAENQRYGKIWLLPYQTKKNAGQVTPTAYTWYDELIISRHKIADPGSSSPAPTDTTAPVLSNIAPSGITATGATITWTTDEASDSQVEYGTTTSYGNQTTQNASLV